MALKLNDLERSQQKSTCGKTPAAQEGGSLLPDDVKQQPPLGGHSKSADHTFDFAFGPNSTATQGLPSLLDDSRLFLRVVARRTLCLGELHSSNGVARLRDAAHEKAGAGVEVRRCFGA
jgi:hypothetical protein